MSHDMITVMVTSHVVAREGYRMLWQPLVTKLIKIQAINLKDGYHCEDHKRTRQEVSAELLPYLYKL